MHISRRPELSNLELLSWSKNPCINEAQRFDIVLVIMVTKLPMWMFYMDIQKITQLVINGEGTWTKMFYKYNFASKTTLFLQCCLWVRLYI